MHIGEDGHVSGSINRAELVAAYNEASDETVKANLAAVGAENGMYVEGGSLVDPSAEPVEYAETEAAAESAEAEAVAEPESSEPTGPYDAMSKQELQDELAGRGLATSGNKDELVARLEEDDSV